MHALTLLIHLSAAIVWMGGMTCLLFALRPAAMTCLEPQPRALLMVQVWRRFFALVLGAIVALLLSGGFLFAVAGGAAPLGWQLMAGLGLLMCAIFGHLYFAGFRRFRRAVAAAEWPVAARAAGRIHRLVWTNFVLGWLAIAAVKLLPASAL